VKKIDSLILRNFIGPFAITFVIALFVLVLQFLWKYVDDLVGKGLELGIIIELIFYLSASLVPLALPLAILIGSIITFGNLGEHYELVALKSAGISLQRFMVPLLVLSIAFAFVAFWFMDNVLPKANLKFRTTLYRIVKAKPALNIQEGIFYEGIDGYVIRIEDKEEDNQTIHNVKIWDKKKTESSKSSVLSAKRGNMRITPDERLLIFTLEDGWRYEEMKSKDAEKVNAMPHMRTYFGEYEMVLDLSSFGIKQANESIYKTRPKMLSIAAIKGAIDSLERKDAKIPENTYKRAKPYFSLFKDSALAQVNPIDYCYFDKWLGDLNLTKAYKDKVYKKAKDDAKALAKQGNMGASQLKSGDRRLVRYFLAWYDKYATAFSCILLYIVGAAMGAIIRKGGLGMPMVVGILFFMVYYVMMTMGRKMAEENAITAFNGVWMATYVLLPVAVFLMYHAINDSPIFNADSYKRLFKKFTPNNN